MGMTSSDVSTNQTPSHPAKGVGTFFSSYERGNDTITVVIADDHPLIILGLKIIIEKGGDIVVIGEASNGQAALETIERLSPTVAVVDIEMPLMSGMEVVRQIQQRNIPTLPIVFTLYDERDVFDCALASGARGYMLKDTATEEIVRGIRRVAEGDYYVSSKIGRNGSPRKENGGLQSLTPMEHRILKLISEDKSTKEIAAQLYISHRTVDHHRASMCSKLGVSGSFALIRFAVEHKAVL